MKAGASQLGDHVSSRLTSITAHRSSSNSLNVSLNRVDRTVRVDHVDAAAGFRSFSQKAFAESFSVFIPLVFHAVQRSLQPTIRRSRRHVEQEHRVWFNAVDRHLADRANRFEVESPGVSLIDEIGEQVTVRNDRFTCGQGGPDHFIHQLCPSGHV